MKTQETQFYHYASIRFMNYSYLVTGRFNNAFQLQWLYSVEWLGHCK
jgi:hypothetical protein